VLNSRMNWSEVSIHTTPNSYPKSAPPGEIRVRGILPALIRTVGSVAEFRDRLSASGLPTQLILPQPGETVEV